MLLMTGATGTVGREVVTRLSAQGLEVRAVTRDLRNMDAHRLPHVEFVQGNFEDLESMRRACAGVDRAFLLTNSTARGGATDLLHARGPPERHAAPREAVAVAR
jgi:uncharacterized protein YbjT (DUF2867 family)